MIIVNRARYIDASPDAVFAALSNPHNLAGIMPRVRRVEMVDQQPDHALIATHMSFGLFGDIRTEGVVRWQRDREVIFSARRPLPVEARWTLRPANGGTDLQAALALDLAPL